MAVFRKAQQSAEWRSGWKLVLACFVGFSFFSVIAASLSIFIEPLVREFGWSRTLVSSGLLICTLVIALLSPFVGMLIDRFGTRRVAIPGILATALVLASFSLLNGSETQWLAFWGIYAAIAVLIKTTVWTTAVAGVFTNARGLALGVVLAGTAAAQAIVPPLANLLIEQFGWRSTYVILSVGWGSLTLFLCYRFLFDAHDRHTPPPDQTRKPGKIINQPEFSGLSIKQACRDQALWIILASTAVMMLLSVGLMVHQIPILTAAGVSRTTAAWLASMAGVAAVAGKLITGTLLDHYRPNWVGGLTLAVTCLAFALLIDGIRSPAFIVFAMLVNGYTSGTQLQISGYLTVRYAGMKNFGMVFGTITGVSALASGLGPVVAGLIFDLSGGYSLFLIIGAAGSLVSGLFLIALPSYPTWPDEASVPDRALSLPINNPS